MNVSEGLSYNAAMEKRKMAWKGDCTEKARSRIKFGEGFYNFLIDFLMGKSIMLVG